MLGQVSLLIRLSVPHGGYVTSVFLNVIRQHFSTTLSGQKQPHTITLHLEFLRRTSTGPALFTVRDVKLGRQTSTVHVALSQSSENVSREEVVGYATNSDIQAESGVTFHTNWSLHPEPLAVDLNRLGTGTDVNYTRQNDLPFSDFRKASSRVDWMVPRQGQREQSWADQWLRFNTLHPSHVGTSGQAQQSDRFTNESLGFVADMFPQIVECFLDPDAYRPRSSTTERSQDTTKSAKYWFPTLLLNLDTKKPLPANGVEWLFVRVRAKQIKNGRYDLEVIVLDEAGDIICLSHHVCFALSAARNLAKRSSSKQDKL